MVIGHKILGHGSEKVLMLHDWSGDASNYDSLLPLLDLDYFTYCFMDIRGYGKSKLSDGLFNLDEAVSDLVNLLDFLKWDQVHLVGHSMTSMIVEKANLELDKVKSLTVVCPVPACGANAPKEAIEFMEMLCVDNDEAAINQFQSMTCTNQSKAFVTNKVKNWRECSTESARIKYMHMFAKENFAKDVEGNQTPIHVIIGKEDSEYHNYSVMESTYKQWYKNCEITVLNHTGHYPMQEVPVYFVEVLEAHLKNK